MRRDMDLIRDMLLYIEEHGQLPVIEGRSDDEISHHMHLLGDARFIEPAKGVVAAGGIVVGYRGRLTWDGSDYLDSIRDDRLWSKVKSEVSSKVGSVAFDVLKEVAGVFAKQLLFPGV